jgi:curved DNA-binding protein CbpA
MSWSGEAVVFVSIACWKKGKYKGEKKLYLEDKSNELQRNVLSIISSSLSLNVDLTSAKVLECNKKPKKIFQGQTHGHEGFLLTKKQGIDLLKKYPNWQSRIASL